MAGHEAGVIGIAGESKKGKQIHQGSKALESKDFLSVNRRVSPFQKGRTIILKALVDVRLVVWLNSSLGPYLKAMVFKWFDSVDYFSGTRGTFHRSLPSCSY